MTSLETNVSSSSVTLSEQNEQEAFMHTKLSAFCAEKFDRIKSYSIYDTFGSINRARTKTSAILAGALILANTVTFAAPATVDITIVDNGITHNAVAVKTTVEAVLESQGIDLGSYDMVTPEPESMVEDDQVIVIDRVKKVTLNDGGDTSEYFTVKNTVGEFLQENGINIGFYDLIDKSYDSALTEDVELNITRVVKTIVSVDEPIPFQTVTTKSDSLLEGTTRVTNNGAEGILTKKYEVFLHNGVEQKRTEVSSEITRKPVDKVISIGTRPDPGKPPKSYAKVITCTATAYDLSFQSCGKRPGDRGYGITATGTHAKYGTVAVDPRVIPLGSKLFIETSDGRFVYGYATAEDTGGAIKGNKVDLFFPTYNECMQFGRRSVKVYILN